MNHRAFLALPATLMLLLVAACASNPYANATTPEAYALDTYEAAAALVHVAAEMWVDPSIDIKIKQPAHDAALALEGPLSLLHDAAIAVEDAKVALAAGTGTVAQLQIALELLSQTQADLSVPLHTLTEAVK